jgi:hypothetical protein
MRSFLQDYLKEPRAPDSWNPKYMYAFVDLDGRGKNQVLVYITGQGWCGSGG